MSTTISSFKTLEQLHGEKYTNNPSLCSSAWVWPVLELSSTYHSTSWFLFSSNSGQARPEHWEEFLLYHGESPICNARCSFVEASILWVGSRLQSYSTNSSLPYVLASILSFASRRLEWFFQCTSFSPTKKSNIQGQYLHQSTITWSPWWNSCNRSLYPTAYWALQTVPSC